MRQNCGMQPGFVRQMNVHTEIILTLLSAMVTYIVGFFLAAYAIGQFANRPIIGILLGSLIIYSCGVAGLILILNTSLQNAITIGVIPFLIGDFIKSFLAIALPS